LESFAAHNLATLLPVLPFWSQLASPVCRTAESKRGTSLADWHTDQPYSPTKSLLLPDNTEREKRGKKKKKKTASHLLRFNQNKRERREKKKCAYSLALFIADDKSNEYEQKKPTKTLGHGGNLESVGLMEFFQKSEVSPRDEFRE
jgi:hypothetical protein